jgi:hypothetical protein
MKSTAKLFVIVALVALAAGCCKRVMIPPAVDLKPYELIGLIEFGSGAKGNLAGYVTRKFMENITEDQKMLQVVELGPENEVLGAVQRPRLDADALKAIAEKYKVRTIITGDLVISDVRPKIHFAPGFHYVGVSADVEASLTAKMLNPENGATIWSGSARQKREVGNVSFNEGHFWFDAKDPESAYGGLTDALVRETTQDFRHTWRWE